MGEARTTSGVRGSAVAILMLALCACSSRTGPAPVSSVEPFYTYEANSLSGDFHTVNKGETLYSIAWMAGTTVDEIARWNALDAPYNIHPGDRLRIRPLSSKAGYHTVTTGETLYSIAKASGATVSQLAAWNGLKPPYTLQPGQQLRLTHATPTSRHKNRKSETSAKPSQQAPAGGVDQPKTKAYVGVSDSGKKEKFSTRVTWHWPASGRVISKFSAGNQGNKGIDIAGAAGTKIYASAGGKVVYAGSALRGFGNLIIIKHNDTYLSAYAHNRKIWVEEQQWVKAGQHIADMGDTEAERVMLHFEIRKKGQSVDPLRYLPRR